MAALIVFMPPHQRGWVTIRRRQSSVHAQQHLLVSCPIAWIYPAAHFTANAFRSELIFTVADIHLLK
jgi:hypothetical protein